MSINAVVIADSISPYGIRLTTIQITLHRYVLAEFNTHRQFSRSFRSSRAVPVAKLLKEVRENPACPIVWQSNKPGMQGGELLGETAIKECQAIWLKSAQQAADYAEELSRLGLHKSWVNRLLESYLYVHGIVTSTEWANFYALRRHADAQPEIKALADAMWDAQQASTPKLLLPGEWHLPYVNIKEEVNRLPSVPNGYIHTSRYAEEDWFTECLKNLSAARCARTSYLTHDARVPNVEEDLKLAEKLLVSGHMSPFEHQGTPDIQVWGLWNTRYCHGNFVGWCQARHMLPNESVKDR